MSNTILTGEAAADILAAMQKAGLNGWEMFVPEGVEEIAPGAFAGMKNLRRVQLPKTLRRIGAAAFYGCGNLAQIALPAGLVELGTAAFKIAVCRRYASRPEWQGWAAKFSQTVLCGAPR